MNLITWNIRGFGQIARRRKVKNYIVREGVDVLGLQEIIRHDFTMGDIDYLTGAHKFVCRWMAASGRSGRILLGVKNDILR